MFLIIAMCTSVFAKETEVVSVDSSVCAKSLASELLVAPEDGLHFRGFLGTLPERTEETEAEMKKIGVDWWGARIYVLPNLEIAKRFDSHRENNDILMKGFYLFNSDVSMDEALEEFESFDSSEKDKEVAEKKQKDLALNIFEASLAKQGMWYFNGEEFTPVPPGLVEKLFTPENLSINETEGNVRMPMEEGSDKYYGGAYLYQRGWFYTKFVGVIMTDEYYEKHKPGGSSTYMNLRKKMRKYARTEGWEVRFNSDIEAVIELTDKQIRKDQGGNSNRFTEEDYASFRSAFDDGKLFTVEVWNGQGELVAGTFGFRTGNVYHPETLAYAQAIDKANYAVLAILERLYQAGISFLNTGMVTSNTARMGGYYLEREDYNRLEAELPKEVLEVDLTTPWDPYPPWLSELRENP